MTTKKTMQEGFSFIELLVVLAVMAILSVSLVSNFRDSADNANARHEISSLVLADIRRAQSLALSGSQWQGQVVCGYGIHYQDAQSYTIFAGIKTGAELSCASHPHQWRGSDFTVETRVFTNNKFAVVGPGGGVFSDVFFEPPDPKTYLDGSYSLITAPLSADIQIVKKGESCVSSNCTTITVHTSGRIDISN